MNLHDLERKIDQKADDWKVTNLQNEIQHLKRDNDSLNRKLDQMNNTISNQREAINQICDMLSQGTQYADDNQSVFYNIKNSI